jgi:hypothetical protein
MEHTMSTQHADSAIEVRWSSGETDGRNGVEWFVNLRQADRYARQLKTDGWDVRLIEWAPDMVQARQERDY